MKKTGFMIGAALVFLLFGRCTDEEDKSITLSISQQILYPGDDFQIEATSITPITYSSENEYHASVSASGLITARFVGETNIVLSNENDTKKIQVIVKANSNLYPEPNLEFGTSKSALIEKLGTPDAETEEGIAYDNFAIAAPMVMYFFDDNNKLEFTSVVVRTEYSSELGTFLAERYLPISIEDLIFINALEEDNATMLVGAELYNVSHWFVIYAPISLTTKNYKLGDTSCFDDLFQQLIK